MSEIVNPSDRTQRGERPRRRRRNPKKKLDARLNPVQAVKQAARAAPTEVPVELPFSNEEVRQLKRHFEFLRTYRRTLKLRVNAAEDLLLNGQVEPTHRGVCQHLLSKIDRARVLQAAERMKPDEATRFLAGILRVAPEVDYLLRFLECVKESSDRADAASALTHALNNLDFESTSDAQMRTVLRLIVEVFPEQEQPAFLLGLLRGAAFREAFDRTSEGLPESLALILAPMREIHELLSPRDKARGRRRQTREKQASNPELLRQGALLLLRTQPKSLLAFPLRVRLRMFELVVDLTHERDAVPIASLFALFESLNFEGDEQREHKVRQLVGLLLRSDHEKAARQLLRKQSAKSSQRLLELLDAPRLGQFAFPSRVKDSARQDDKKQKHRPSREQSVPEHKPHSWVVAVSLQTQEKVRVYYGDEADASSWNSLRALWERALLPQVQLPLVFGDGTAQSPPYLVVARLETSLARRLETASLKHFRKFLLDLCRIANGLAALGIELRDASLQPFAVDLHDVVWLTDLTGATNVEPSFPLQSSWVGGVIGKAFEISPHATLAAEDAKWLATERCVAKIVVRLRLWPL